MPRLTADVDNWAKELQRIEDMGFHAVAISEHYSQGWAMEALTAMNFALASTTHLRAMPLVLNNDLHHPAVLAKAVSTAHILSAGRVGLGLGAGWLEDDYNALGASFSPAPVRVARLEEALRVIRAFFGGGMVDFDGAYYKLDKLEAIPHVTHGPHPPILVGGGGKRILDLAGRYADIVGLHPRMGLGGFNKTAADQLSKSGIEDKISLVAASAARAGKPAPEIQMTCWDVNISNVQVTPIKPAFSDYIAAHPKRFADSPVSVRGDVGKCVDDLRRWNEELGISYWNLGGRLDAVAPVVAQLSSELASVHEPSALGDGDCCVWRNAWHARPAPRKPG
jgi:probable F420-dependent oxidoreductase